MTRPRTLKRTQARQHSQLAVIERLVIVFSADTKRKHQTYTRH